MKKILAAALTLALVMSLVVIGCAAAETKWPKKPVTVILPYSAGGDTDTYCRTLFKRVGDELGQTFVVTNMTGGNGVVAAKTVMSKKNDGYTLLFCHTGAALVQEATGFVDFSYTNDFENCCTVAIDQTYSLFALSKEGTYGQYSRGWKNLEDMIADAKAHPGEVRWSNVHGSATHYVAAMLEKDAGIKLDKIDVGADTATRMTSMLGGKVDLVAANYMNMKDYIDNGDMICLGVMADEEVPGIKFKTFKEQGYPDVVTAKKYVIKFPKGTKAEIIEKLADVCKKVVAEPEFAETLASFYAQPFFRDAERMNTEDVAEVEAIRAAIGTAK